ncbi:FUSC family protein [Streptomyces heliomycini]
MIQGRETVRARGRRIRVCVRDGRECGGVKAAGRSVRARLRDRLAASDPGLLRLTAGLRTVGAVALTLAVLAPAGSDITHLVAGAMAAMVATFSIRERRRDAQAVTLAVGLPVALVSVSLGRGAQRPGRRRGRLLRRPHLLRGLRPPVRRPRDRARADRLPGLLPCPVRRRLRLRAAGAVGRPDRRVRVQRAGAVRRRPRDATGTLARLRQAFRARLGRLVSAYLALLDAGPDEVDKALEDVREGNARLHETALMIQSRLEEGTPDESSARLVQRRIADAEIAAERLGLLCCRRAAPSGRTPSPCTCRARPPPEVGRLPGPDESTAVLRRDLLALRALVVRAGPGGTGRGPAAQPAARLPGRGEPAGRHPGRAGTCFRAVGETARAVMGLRVALEGPQDESDDSPATARSREELDAEDAAIDAGEEEEPAERRKGLQLAHPRGPPRRSPWARRWPSPAASCCPRTAGTGRCSPAGSCSSTRPRPARSWSRATGGCWARCSGVVAGIVLAAWWAPHLDGLRPGAGADLHDVLHAPLSTRVMTFFVTAMLRLLYTLLHTYSWEVLVLRVEVTAPGRGLRGGRAAALVLPVRTDRRTDELLVTVLERLAEVTEAAVGQAQRRARGRPAGQGAAVGPGAGRPALRHPAADASGHPAAGPAHTNARYVVALLETCAYHARRWPPRRSCCRPTRRSRRTPGCAGRRGARCATS